MKNTYFTGAWLLGIILMTSCEKAELLDANTANALSKNQQAAALDQKAGGKKTHTSNADIKIGSLYGGGMVFYLDETGQHGLIVAIEDAGKAEWGCKGVVVPGTFNQLGTGQQNTNAILASCNEPCSAARLADTWISKDRRSKPMRQGKGWHHEKDNKYDDWYLPSLNESNRLNEIVRILKSRDLPYLDLVFPDGYCIPENIDQLLPFGNYWTSSQGDNSFMGTVFDGATMAWIIKYQTDAERTQIVYVETKNFKALVRPIRSF